MKIYRQLQLLASQFASSKRIIPMSPIKVEIDDAEIQKTKTRAFSQSQGQKVNSIPSQWQLMPFDKLCALNQSVIEAISLEIKKNKLSVSDQEFVPAFIFEKPEEHLNEYWANIYRTLCNLQSIPQKKLDKIKQHAYLGRIFLDEPEEDELLREMITKFVNNLKKAGSCLEAIAEPTFRKYLLFLRRDLLTQGCDISLFGSAAEKEVRIVSVLNYEYEFWVDVKHNRAKNGTEDDFIIEKKTIDNPNTTIVVTDLWPKVDVTYITRIKKRKEVEMSFCVKADLLLEVDGMTHVIKVEKKGPSSSAETSTKQCPYWIIDYDGLFKGNPTVRPVFQF